MPGVLHGVWASRNKIGYVLVNWSDEPENVKLSLANKEGSVSLITAIERKQAAEELVRSGQIITIAAPQASYG